MKGFFNTRICFAVAVIVMCCMMFSCSAGISPSSSKSSESSGFEASSQASESASSISCASSSKQPESSLSKGTSSASSKPAPSDAMLKLALAAQQDMLKNFWRGDAKTGHMMKEDHGLETAGQQYMIWAHTMMLLGMDIMYEATGDPELKDRIAAQWNFTRDNFTEEMLTRPGRWPNIAVDDAGWDAMAYMIWYRVTGDSYALKVAGKTIRNSYEYWKDGTVANGLWYIRDKERPENDATFKSLYSVGLVMAALDYCAVTDDQSLLDDTLAVYRWMENNLLRDGKKEYPTFVLDCHDHLYFTDFNVNRPSRTEPNGPDGGVRPYDIKEAGSVSFLAGNMAMGAIHARLYKMTGDEHYKKRALETVRAITDGPYNNKGVLLNDRDAWTTASFVKWWVSEVLTLPGVTKQDRELFFNTARSIYNNARTSKGYYGGSWSGPAEGNGSAWYRGGSVPEQIMTSANSTNIIMAAALLEKLVQ